MYLKGSLFGLVVLLLLIPFSKAEGISPQKLIAWQDVLEDENIFIESSFDNNKGKDSLILPAGQSISVQLNRLKWLKIKKQKELPLKVFSSISKGIEYHASESQLNNFTSLVQPKRQHQLIRIHNISTQEQHLNIYIGSELNNTTTTSGFANIAPNNASMDSLIKLPSSVMHQATLLNEDYVSFDIQGPKLIQISSMVTNSYVPETPVNWHLSAKINDQKKQTWQHLSHISQKHYWQKDGSFFGTGFKNHYIVIPEGKHKLSLATPQKTWVKVQQVSDNYFFESNANFLQKSVIKQSVSALIEKQNMQQSALRAFDSAKWLQHPEKSLHQLSKLMTDYEIANFLNSSGLSFDQDVIPSNKNINTLNITSINQKWLPKVNDNDVRFINKKQLNAQYQKASTTRFYKVTKTSPLSFTLPKGRILGDIKLKVYNPKEITAGIKLGTDKHSKMVYIKPKHNNTKLGAQSINNVVNNMATTKDTHKVIFGKKVNKHSEALFNIDDQVEHLTLSADNSQPIYVALSFRNYNKLSMSEENWIQAFSKPVNLEALQTSANTHSLHTLLVKRLKILINLRSEQFLSGVAKNSSITLDNDIDKFWLPKAEVLLNNDQLVELTKLLFSQKRHSLKLWQWRLNVLKEQGIWQNYIIQLKGLLASNNSELNNLAAEHLRGLYQQQNNILALSQVAAVEINKKTNAASIYNFAKTQFQQANYTDALTALSLISAYDSASELALWIAVKQQKWRLYHNLLSKLPEDKRPFYQGLNAWFNKDNQLAAKYWHVTTEQIQKHNHLLDLVSLMDIKNIVIPVVKTKQSVYAVNAKEMASIFNPQRNTNTLSFIALPDHKVSTTVIGPTTLTLSARQLKSSIDSKSKDDWLTIKVNNRYFYYPINNSSYTSQLQIKNSEYYLGNKTEIVLPLDSGKNTIEVVPSNFKTAINIDTTSNILTGYQQRELSLDCSSSLNWYVVNESQSHSLCIAKLMGEKSQLKHQQKPVNNNDWHSLARHIYDWENSIFTDHKALVSANKIAENYKNNILFRSLNTRLNKHQKWQLLQPIQSAGLSFIEGSSLPSINKGTRYNKAIIGIPTIDQTGIYFKNNKSQQIFTAYKQKQRARLTFNSYLMPFAILDFVEINIYLSGSLLKPLKLPLNKEAVFEFDIPAGEQEVIVEIKNQYQQFMAKSTFSILNNEGHWQVVTKMKKRNIYVANKTSSLKYYLDAPAYLQIDYYKEGKLSSSKVHHQEQAGFFELEGQKSPTKVRVYQIVGEPEKEDAKPTFYAKNKTDNVQIKQPIRMLNNSVDFNLFQSTDSIIESSGDTWGLSYQLRRRFNYSEDFNPEAEQFNQVGFHDRNYNQEKNRFWRLDALAREHKKGQTVFGLKNYLEWLQPETKQRYYANIAAYYQTDESVQESAWSGTATLGWHNQFDLQTSLRNLFDISFFAQHTSHKNQKGAWDNDVYTEHKQKHSNGFNISNTFRYKPFQDVEFDVNINARTNPMSEDLSIDSTGLKLSSHIYFKGALVDFSFQKKFYYSDESRRFYNIRERWSLALQHRFWLAQSNKWHLKAGIHYDPDLDNQAFNLSVAWNDTGSKQLDDFRLSEVRFRSLYQQQATNSTYLKKGVEQ